MQRSACAGRDEWQGDLCLHHGREILLRLFACFLQTLHRHLIVSQIDAVFLLEGIDHPVDDDIVEIIAAQMRITICGQYFKCTVSQFQDGDIERTSAQVINEDLLFLVGLVDSISQRCCGRFVDDALDLQSGDASGILRRLTLRVVEVSRHGDDRLGDGRADICFRICFQLLQDHCGDLLRRILLSFHFYLFARAHQTLDGRDRVLVGHRLTLCGVTDDALSILVCDH